MFPIYRGGLTARASTLRDAVVAYNHDNPRDWGRPGTGTCPVCGHHACFGKLPDTPQRWHCFSANHDKVVGRDGKPVGLRGSAGWHGDALDIYALTAGLSRVEHLRACGYLPAKGGKQT